MISSLSATELCRFHCEYTCDSVRHYHQLLYCYIYSNFHAFVHYFLDLISEVSMKWTHGRRTRTHDQNAVHPVSLQVIAEEWILKAKSWEGAKGFAEICLAKTRLVSRLYLNDLQMMSFLHEAVMFVERKTCSLIQCVIAINLYIPGTCLSYIPGFEPSKRRPFPFKTRVIWVPFVV